MKDKAFPVNEGMNKMNYRYCIIHVFNTSTAP